MTMPLRRAALVASLALLALVAPSPASAVEVAARLGLSAPTGEGLDLGPTAGLSVSVPLRGRLSLLAAGDFSTHRVAGQPGLPIDSMTAVLGVEASIDLAPIVPVLAVGPAFQHAWRRSGSESVDAFGGFLAIGVRATLFEHLRLGLQARYLTSAFSSNTFPAFVTFVLELGWTSGEL
ncbi:MAG: hypothetical protein QM765_01815 [Myxococcales bacterium]